jgi:uncharacterized membrane protein YecN with MAPEG domain
MITSIFASILGILYFRLSLDTISSRRKNKVSLGAGDNNQVLQVMSAHSNYSNYVPILLILLYLLESSQKIPWWAIVLLGSIFTLGRVLHYLAFKNKMNFKLRVRGMQMTLIPLMIMSVMNLIVFLINLF